jgi:hypothetical protein
MTKTKLVCLLMALLLFIASCMEQEQDTLTEEPILQSKNITVAEVKDRYDQLTRTDGRKRQYDSIGIKWDIHVFKELNVGDAVAFSIDSEAGLYVSGSADGVKYPMRASSFALAYKDEEGEVVLEHFVPVPTASASTDLFTGYFLVSEWAGEAKRVLYYEEGELVEERAVVSSAYNSKDSQAHRAASNCTITDHWWCVTATGGGSSYTTCTYEGSTMTCTESPVFADPDPVDPGVGGGGSSPSGPGGLCAHPFIEGLYVDCDEVICGPGSVKDEEGNCVPQLPCAGSPCCDENGNLIQDCENDRPCPDNPLKKMEITSPGNSGKNGGRFGCTRNGMNCPADSTRKKHDGLDITASIGTYIFTPRQGKVVEVRNDLDWGEYRKDSYGNYVTIKYTGGSQGTYYMKYNHLDFVYVKVGDILGPGMIIGRSGRTGNAAKVGVTPHVHFQVYNSSWVSVDPEDYLKVTYDENGNLITNPCN